MNPTAQYRDWHAAEPTAFPLFHQPWWLDTVCGPGQWEVLLAEHPKHGRRAFLPLTWQRRYGLRIINKPPLTPFLGPLFTHPDDRDKLPLLDDLVRQTPRPLLFKTTFRPEQPMALPFHWAGFQLRTRYTYRLPLQSPRHRLSQGFRRDIRRNIHKGEATFQLTRATDHAALHQLITATFRRQGRPAPITASFLARLTTAASQRGQGDIRLALDAAGDPQGGLFLATDDRYAYLLISGLTEQGRRHGAFPWLLWQVLQALPEQLQGLDFCGSMLPQVATVNAGFGAEVRSYVEVGKKRFWR